MAPGLALGASGGLKAEAGEIASLIVVLLLTGASSSRALMAWK
jgi:hypothetical protein